MTLYLLDLTIGGHVYRYATEAVVVSDAAGRSYRYAAGLSEPGLSYGSLAGVDDASVSIEVVSEVDWPRLVADGHPLEQQPALLRRWVEGQDLERARVVIRGLTSDPQYDEAGAPLSVSIVRSPRSQSRTIPSPQAVVDTSTWPVTGGGWSSPEGMRGAVYPVVIGAPGGTEDATPIPCVPAPQAEHPSAAGDGRLVWVGGAATQVRVRYDGDTPAESDETVSAISDLLGTQLQCADTSGFFVDPGSYYVGFRDDSTYGGGLLYRGQLLRGAGSVIEWALTEHYDGEVDLGRTAAARAYLDRYKIDTWINSPIVVWDWLVQEVLPLLPVEMRDGARGIYPALVRYDLQRSDAVAHLDATPGSGRVTRARPVRWVGRPVNEVSIDYRPGSESGSRWLARRVVTSAQRSARSDLAADARVVTHPAATRSCGRYGLRETRLQLGAVWDTTTALQVGVDLITASTPRPVVQYSGASWLEELEIGQAVTVTDPGLHYTEVVARVEDVTPGDEVLVDLLIL